MTPGLNITLKMASLTVKNINPVYWKHLVDKENDDNDNERVNQ